jgi:hypothetical protein
MCMIDFIYSSLFANRHKAEKIMKINQLKRSESFTKTYSYLALLIVGVSAFCIRKFFLRAASQDTTRNSLKVLQYLARNVSFRFAMAS